MKRRTYPYCDKCDAEINPNLFDDCDHYYLIGGDVYCRDCFKDWLLDWVESNLDDVAELAGVPVVEV